MDNIDRNPACAIVVSFNPETDVLLALLRQLGAQTDFILIDNNSANLSEFDAAVQVLPGCVGFRKLPENAGLASAINLGLRFALEQQYQVALLFDQDSELGEDFCSNMMSALAEAEALGGLPVAAVGPRVQNPETGRHLPFKRFDRLFARADSKPAATGTLFHTDFLISSGTLLVLKHLTVIGLMKDDYFIDNIDLEWCFRANSLGFALYGTDRTRLHHRIGEPSSNILVRQGMLTKHSPLRAYYSTRNRLNLYTKTYAPRQWKIRDFIRFTLKSLWLVVFSGQRGAYWKNIRRGIADAKALT